MTKTVDELDARVTLQAGEVATDEEWAEIQRRVEEAAEKWGEEREES